MLNFRPDKKLKRKQQHKDWKRRKNILKAWRDCQHGIFSWDDIPIHFSESRKFTKSKKMEFYGSMGNGEEEIKKKKENDKDKS